MPSQLVIIHNKTPSDRAIYSNALQRDCSGMKRSKIFHSSSDLLDIEFPKKVTSSRECRSDVVFLRKVPLRRSVLKLNFVEDITDDDETGAALMLSQHSGEFPLPVQTSVVKIKQMLQMLKTRQNCYFSSRAVTYF